MAKNDVDPTRPTTRVNNGSGATSDPTWQRIAQQYAFQQLQNANNNQVLPPAWNNPGPLRPSMGQVNNPAIAPRNPIVGHAMPRNQAMPQGTPQSNAARVSSGNTSMAPSPQVAGRFMVRG